MLDSTVQALRTIFAIVVLGLTVTGGYRGQFEFSQVDLFGFLLLGLSYILFRRTGTPFPDFINRWVTKTVAGFERSPWFWCFVFTAGTCSLYFTIHLAQFLSFHANMFDMTFVEQSIWATAKLWPQEKLLASSVSRGGTYFGEHFSPILMLLAPLQWIIDSPVHVFWVQPLLLVSGLFFILGIAQHRQLPSQATLAVLLGYLLYQPLRSAQIFNLKEDAFFIPTLFAAIWAAEKQRWRVFWIAVGMCFLVKENAPLATAWLALWLMAKGRKKSGTVLLLLSASIFIFLNFYFSSIMAAGEKRAMIAERLFFLGSSPKEIGFNLFYHPFDSLIKIQKYVFNLKSLRYLFQVLLPFLPFVFLRPWRDGILYLAAIALLLANLLFTPRTLGYHYEIILVPFLFSALVFSFSRLKQQRRFAPALFLALVFCVFGRSPILTLREVWPNSKQLCLNKALQAVPSNVSIATQSDLMPHLHRRLDISILKSAETVREDVIILSFLEGMSFYASDAARAASQQLQPSKYRPLSNNPDLMIWCREGEGCEKFSGFKMPECFNGS